MWAFKLLRKCLSSCRAHLRDKLELSFFCRAVPSASPACPDLRGEPRGCPPQPRKPSFRHNQSSPLTFLPSRSSFNILFTAGRCNRHKETALNCVRTTESCELLRAP